MGMEEPMGSLGMLFRDAHWAAVWGFPLIPSGGAGIGMEFYFLPGAGCRVQPWEMRIGPVPVSSSWEQL